MPSKKTTIAITGANGFLGSHLVQHFAAKDWNVIALVRNPSTQHQEGIREYAFDMEGEIDADALRNVDYLVHAAYIKYDPAHPNALEENVAGGIKLLEASRKQKIAKNIFISSMSAHDQAISTYGRQKLAVEELFSGRKDVILRPGLIIGNGGIVRQMADFMRTKHAVPLIGGGAQPLQIISVTDLAQVVENCITRDLSGTFIAATPQVYSYKDFYRALSRWLNTWVLFMPVPFFVLQTLMRGIAILHLPLAVNEDNLLGLKKLRAFDNAADMQKIGVEPDGLEAALQRLSNSSEGA